jgi:DNA-binding transcriptional LysR family regulator
MELRQLRAFVEVAALGHFGHAAERLHLTQPALTQRIQALERELGFQLLERNAREVRLAPPGAILLPHARRLIEAEDMALADLKAYSSGVVGRLRLAYQSAGDVATAGAIIAEYRRRYPGVEVETVSGSSGPNVQLVQNHAADAAFALMSGTVPDGLSTRTIRREEIALALRSDHHLAAMDPIPVSALRGEPVGLPPAASNPYLLGALRRWFVKHLGEELNVVSEDPTDIALETVARSGAGGVFVVPRYLLMEPAPGLVYSRLSPAPLFELAIVYSHGNESPTLANLREVVDDFARKSSSNGYDGELI